MAPSSLFNRINLVLGLGSKNGITRVVSLSPSTRVLNIYNVSRENPYKLIVLLSNLVRI